MAFVNNNIVVDKSHCALTASERVFSVMQATENTLSEAVGVAGITKYFCDKIARHVKRLALYLSTNKMDLLFT